MLGRIIACNMTRDKNLGNLKCNIGIAEDWDTDMLYTKMY